MDSLYARLMTWCLRHSDRRRVFKKWPDYSMNIKVVMLLIPFSFAVQKKQSRLLAFAVMTSICTGQESDDVQLHLMRSKEVASWSNWGKQKSVLWFWMYQFAYRYRCWWSRKEGRWSMLLTEPAWQCGIYNLCSSNCVLSKFIEQIWWWIHWTRS